MKKFVKCSHCGNCEWFEVDTSPAKFDGDENEVLQKECFRLKNRIDKLQYKHDFVDLTSWQLNDVNNRLSALKKILDILENCI